MKPSWFEMVKGGDRLEDYRPYNEYWIKRIHRNFERVVCSMGFGKNKSKFTLSFEGLEIRSESIHPEWGEPETTHFVIKLGKRA